MIRPAQYRIEIVAVVDDGKWLDPVRVAPIVVDARNVDDIVRLITERLNDANTG